MNAFTRELRWYMYNVLTMLFHLIQSQHLKIQVKINLPFILQLGTVREATQSNRKLYKLKDKIEARTIM